MNRMLDLSLHDHAGAYSGAGIACPDITVEFHEHGTPSFVRSELELLYESLYSTLPQFRCRADDGLAGVHTYAVRRAGIPRAILLFRMEGSIVRVLNEVMAIKGVEIDQFAEHVFEKFKSASAIVFHAIRPDAARLAHRNHRFDVMEDIVLSLPASEEEYLAALGKSTRRTIKYYSNKLKRAFPSFQHRIFSKDDITQEHVCAIVGMKAAQMAKKNRASIVNEKDVDRMLNLARIYGVVGIATIDGKVCAGWIGYRVGGNDFMDICAYDPAFEEYRLGTICCYLAIANCIARRGKECHFQWGQDDYKIRFLGMQRTLFDLIIYRSPASMLLHAGRFWKPAATHLRRKIKEAGWFKSVPSMIQYLHKRHGPAGNRISS